MSEVGPLLVSGRGQARQCQAGGVVMLDGVRPDRPGWGRHTAVQPYSRTGHNQLQRLTERVASLLAQFHGQKVKKTKYERT